MPKSKVRNVVSVEVEEFNPVVAEPTWRESHVETKTERKKASLGAWWELSTGGALFVGLLSIILGRSNFGTQTEVPFSLVILLLGVCIAAISGRFYASEAVSRRIVGLVAFLVGVAFLCLSIVWNRLPEWSWLLSIGLGLTMFGWGLRRLVDESWIRVFSLGLVLIVPFLFLKDSLLPARTLSALQTNIDQLTFWYAGVWADVNKVPFTPFADESEPTKEIAQTTKAPKAPVPKKGASVVPAKPTPIGIRFANGVVRSSGAFDNFAGLLVAVALSLCVSVSARHSLLVASICVCIAIMWWLVFRGGAFLSLAARSDFEGPLVTQAMSIGWMLLMFGLIIASSLSLGAIIAPIPIDSNQYELSPLTIVYNAVVSFPQLGPSNVGMLPDSATESADMSSNMVQSESDQQGDFT
jgi:hypothetical protein